MDPGFTSRAKPRPVGLIPNAWVVAFQKEAFVGDPAFQYSRITFSVGQSPGYFPLEGQVPPGAQLANAFVAVQDSPTGAAGSWTTILNDRIPIVPGGVRHTISQWHRQAFVRVIAWSTGSGTLLFTVQEEEDQVLPGLWPDVGAMACSSWCEADCETGNETVG